VTLRLSILVCALAGWLCAAPPRISAPPPAPLVDAVKARDHATVRALLAKHANVNSAEADGTTALQWAVRQDDLGAVNALLHAGANAKTANRYGITPLSLACTNGNGEIVAALLKAGADSNTTLPGGETALMTASRTGKVVAIQALLASGAVVNAKESSRGQTALMWAAAEGNVEAVNLLVRAGADIHARLDTGFTAFLFAAREGRIGVADALLKAGADVNDTIQPHQGAGPKLPSVSGAPKAGVSAMVLATTNAHFELAAKLLDAGADPNAAGAGYTALHVITQVRKPGGGDNDPPPDGSGNITSLQLVKDLVKHGANLNARMTKRVNFGATSLNTMSATPFFLAAKTADAELMRAFAELGADPNIPNVEHSTPLMAAAGLGTRSPGEDAGTEPEVIQAMQAALNLGADINAVNDQGETAMHGAAYKNYPSAVLFLAEKGADIQVWNQKNKHGWTPLTIAYGYRFGNYKPSPVTVEALAKVMKAAGVPVPPEEKPVSVAK
jgi:uncharacterized protein